MATVTWDPELAAIAAYNVINCDAKSDECHNTILYTNSGQNIGTTPLSDTITKDKLISNILEGWWDAKSENMAIMASQYQLAVGCAAITYRISEPTFQLTCNYAISANHIFTEGDVASACKQKNPKYDYLCSIDEVYPDYCDPTLCPNGETHIACNNNGAFDSSCPSLIQAIGMTPFINLILDTHNEYRNVLANGVLKDYAQASKLSTIKWDSELAALAAYSIRKCKNIISKACHNTKTFTNSDQIQNVPPMIGKNLRENIKYTLEKWWKNRGGHAFQLMATETQVRVGCAASRDNRLHFTCNYATVPTKPLYTKGKVASGCSERSSVVKQTNLCV